MCSIKVLLVFAALVAILGQGRAEANSALSESDSVSPSSAFTEQATTLGRRLFNAFKSYANTPMSEKPPQYSRAGKNSHGVSDYLTNDQKRMKDLRHSGTVGKEDQFDASWSGHNTYKTLKSKLNARIADAEPKVKAEAEPKVKAKAEPKVKAKAEPKVKAKAKAKPAKPIKQAVKPAKAAAVAAAVAKAKVAAKPVA